MINRLTNSVFSSAIKYTNNELKQNSKAYQHSNSLYNRLYLRYLSIVEAISDYTSGKVVFH